MGLVAEKRALSLPAILISSIFSANSHVWLALPVVDRAVLAETDHMDTAAT